MLTEAQKNLAVQIAKESLDIRTEARSERIAHLVQAVYEELKIDQGIDIDGENLSELNFLADMVRYRYATRGEDGGYMPRTLQWRLHNLFVRKGKGRGEA